jgi:hypothetical protein
VGLAARAIEAAGIPTLTLTLLPAFTRLVGTPRVAGLAHPFGRPLGRVGDADRQRTVLRALEAIDRPGGAVQLPFVWPVPPAKARGTLKEPPPIATLLRHKPWLFLKFVAGQTAD